MRAQFIVNLIETTPNQTQEAINFLQANCTHIYCANDLCNFWIYEGDIECLDDAGVDYCDQGEGIVGCLGDLSQGAKIKLVYDEFGIDVRD